MSWLGGSLSSLTGQISNLTKDILTEGTEEVSDHATELQLAKEKINELEFVCETQKTENERQKKLIQELEVKAEASELQIKSISSQYRTVLEEREQELKALKKQQHEFLEHQTKTSVFLSPSDEHPDSEAELYSGFDGSGYHGDEHDFGDNINLQHEVNRLRTEVQRLQGECRHWKNLAKNKTTGQHAVHEDGDQLGDHSELQRRNKELEENLEREKEQRQQELSSLQDVHSQKLAALHKKHKQEIRDLKKELVNLKQQPGDKEITSPGDHDSQQREKENQDLKLLVEKLKEEITSFQHERSTHLQKIEELEKHLSDSKGEIAKLLEDHDQVSRDLFNTKQKLLDQMDANHADTLEILGDLREVQNLMDNETIEHRNKLLEEKDALVNLIISLGEKHQETKVSLAVLKQQEHTASDELDEVMERMGHSEHQQLTAEIMDTVEKEKLILHKKVLEQQEQITLLERAVQNLTAEKGHSDHAVKGSSHFNQSQAENSLQQSDFTLNWESVSESTSMTTDLSELSRQNEELDEQVVSLKSQIARYEQEIEQFELMKTDWQIEKEALEDVLIKLREQMKEKERSLNVVEAKKESLQQELEAIKVGEKDSILSSTDQAADDGEDKQDQLETALKNRLTQLEIQLHEKEMAHVTLIDEKRNLEAEMSHVQEQLYIAQKELEKLKSENKDLETTLLELSKVQENVKELEEEKANLLLEKQELENSLEALDNQHQEAMEQVISIKEKLHRSNDKLSQKLQEAEERLEQSDRRARELEVRLKEEEEKLRLMEDRKIFEEAGETEEAVLRRDKETEELNIKLEKCETEIQRLRGELAEVNKQQLASQHVESSASNELNQEISDLKEENSKLRTKVNGLTNSVFKLEESLQMKENLITDMKEKMLASASALNDLHMDKQELEKRLEKSQSEIHEKVIKIKELRNDIFELKSENEKLTSKIEACERKSDYAVQEKSDRVKDENEFLIVKEKLQTSSKECGLLNSKLQLVERELENSNQHIEQLKIEKEKALADLDEISSRFSKEKENLDKQYNQRCQEYQTIADALRAEKECLERDLNQLVSKLQTQTQHYESYICELQSSQEKDFSALQKDHGQLMLSCQEKDHQISELKLEMDNLRTQINKSKEIEIENLRTQLKGSKDMAQSAFDGQNQLRAVIEEKNKEITTQVDDIRALQIEREQLVQMVSEKSAEIERLKDFENEFQRSQTENMNLQLELEELNKGFGNRDDIQVENSRSFAETTKFESDLSSSMDQVQELEMKIEKYKQMIKDYEAGIAQLNEKNLERSQLCKEHDNKIQLQDNMIMFLRQTSVDREEEVLVLKQKLQRVRGMLSADQQKILDLETAFVQPNFHLPSIEYQEKKRLEHKEAIEYVPAVEIDKDMNILDKDTDMLDSAKEENDNILDTERTSKVAEEMEELQKRIEDKDDVIAELQKNNASLLKMLELKSKTINGDFTLVEKHKLEEEIKALKLEKEQMMSIMNEKSRECSNLRTEVHRLMNVVTAEKLAIEKLQQDNQELTQKRESAHPNQDMQKEAVQKLSRIIQDKDLEIESLQQKSQTLLNVLQESSQEGAQINNLIKEKENLTKQFATLQSEREQMIVYLNQKYQESVAYHNEIQRLTAHINTEAETTKELRQNYEKLVPQFEDKTQALVKAQNDLLNYKQKFTELEVKYGELLQRSSSSDTVDKASYDSKVEEAHRFQVKYNELLENIKEKESMVRSLRQNVSELEQALASKESERSSYKKQLDHLSFQLQSLQMELKDVKSENTLFKQQNSDYTSEMQLLKEMNNQLTLKHQETESELRSIKDKTVTLTAIMQQKDGEKGQLDHLMKEAEVAQKQFRQVQQERDQAILALRQRQEENDKLNRELARLRDKESKLTKELDRLRQHLLQIEEGYTREALEAEEREKDLRNRLAAAEDKLMRSKSTVETANQQVSQQMESLQQQLHVISHQRDQAYLQVAWLQDQNHQYTVSMANLQMVLEQFQEEKDSMVAQETERYQNEVELLKKKVDQLQAELKTTKVELEEASDGLEAAARLSEQLDHREETIHALREEVQLRENIVKAAEEEIRKLTSSSEAKVEKLVIKNLLLGYFTTPKNKRSEVLHAIGGVLGFSLDDFHKIDDHTGRRWIPGFLRFGPSKPQIQTPPMSPVRSTVSSPITFSTPTAQDKNKSFSEMFVRFLERESSPPPPTVRLPAEEMVRDVQKQKETHKPAFNPFTAPRHVSLPSQVSESSRSRDSHILMGSVAVGNPLQTFASVSNMGPQLTPPSSGRTTPATSSAILKDVLNAR
ncbi:hypothetical protein ACJMK2_036761 [Sinanodonta woodiana]|uniref:GRIP domain-containing protein n=1 Tax=Sinanodonta woodiana TaxID=1069815 RepID=A0ABD3WLL8_SINWO